MEAGFQFEVIYQDDDLLEVRVSAWNGTFGGVANVYLDREGPREMAAKLEGFPNNLSDTREIMMGAFGSGSAGGGVSMQFTCSDGAGHVNVAATIESGTESAGMVQSVTLSILTEAAAIDSFVAELPRMSAVAGGKARLKSVALTSHGPC